MTLVIEFRYERTPCSNKEYKQSAGKWENLHIVDLHLPLRLHCYQAHAMFQSIKWLNSIVNPLDGMLVITGFLSVSSQQSVRLPQQIASSYL